MQPKFLSSDIYIHKKGGSMLKKKIFILVIMISIVPLFIQAESLWLCPSDFLPSHSTTKYVRSQYYLYPCDNSPFKYFYAPIHLPNNAKITSVEYYYLDNHSKSIKFNLWMVNLNTDNWKTYCFFETQDVSSEIRNKKLIPYGKLKIKNANFSYIMQIQFTAADSSVPGKLHLKGVKINYK